MFLTQSASQILPRLYLSGLCTAVDDAQLFSLRVTHILSIIEDRPLYPRALTELKTMHIPLKDNSDVDILSHLDATTTFIKDALVDEKNIVLVALPVLFHLHATHNSYDRIGRCIVH